MEEKGSNFLVKTKLRLCCGLQRHLDTNRTPINHFLVRDHKPLSFHHRQVSQHILTFSQLFGFWYPASSSPHPQPWNGHARCYTFAALVSTLGPFARGKRKRGGEPVRGREWVLFEPFFPGRNTRRGKEYLSGGILEGVRAPSLVSCRLPPTAHHSGCVFFPGPTSPRFGDTHIRVMGVAQRCVTQKAGVAGWRVCAIFLATHGSLRKITELLRLTSPDPWTVHGHTWAKSHSGIWASSWGLRVFFSDRASSERSKPRDLSATCGQPIFFLGGASCRQSVLQAQHTGSGERVAGLGASMPISCPCNSYAHSPAESPEFDKKTKRQDGTLPTCLVLMMKCVAQSQRHPPAVLGAPGNCSERTTGRHEYQQLSTS